jgi:acyl carrier protein
MKNIEKIILDIFKKNLNNKKININSTIQNVVNWDSLNHVNIINETAKKFAIKINFNEMVNINSVKKLIQIVKKKL